MNEFEVGVAENRNGKRQNIKLKAREREVLIKTTIVQSSPGF